LLNTAAPSRNRPVIRAFKEEFEPAEIDYELVEKYTSNEQSFRASKEVRNGIDDYYLILNGATDHKSFLWRTLRPLTPTAVEEVLHNPPSRVAKNGSDIRKLQACIENITPHIEIIPR
jgi:hypothetical protein